MSVVAEASVRVPLSQKVVVKAFGVRIGVDRKWQRQKQKRNRKRKRKRGESGRNGEEEGEEAGTPTSI